MSNAEVRVRRGMPRAGWLDGAAMLLSGLCLLHCLALPIAFALLPTLSTFLAVPEFFHVAMVLVAVPASGAALIGGRARGIGRWPLAVGLMGLTLLAAAVILPISEETETIVTVLGSLTLIGAHAGNWQGRRAHRDAALGPA